MNLIIVTATEREIAPFLEVFESDEKRSAFESAGIAIEVIVTGVGLTNTAFGLGTRFADRNSHIDLVINAGIAGTYNTELKIGTVVNAIQDCIAFFGAEDGDNFIQADSLKLVKKDEIVFDNPQLFQSEVIAALHQVKAITTNLAHGDKSSIERVRSIYHPDIESMEGAAFTLACTKANLPYYQIRAISNMVERRNTENWDIPLAIKNLNETLIDIVGSLVKQK